MKEGGGTSIFGKKNWKNRFFVISLSDRSISYFENENAFKKDGARPLKPALPLNGAVVSQPQGGFDVEIKNAGARGTLRIGLTTKVERQKWLDALLAAGCRDESGKSAPAKVETAKPAVAMTVVDEPSASPASLASARKEDPSPPTPPHVPEPAAEIPAAAVVATEATVTEPAAATEATPAAAQEPAAAEAAPVAAEEAAAPAEVAAEAGAAGAPVEPAADAAAASQGDASEPHPPAVAKPEAPAEEAAPTA